ncbi:hypothetical protein [Escherichia coli]|uniref:hypothetical protein n=1 Tax=Escherichia coli TaxID=562 RepID=UPI00040938B6|nr:hypothetical protein [Escherichia coli]
MAGEKNAGSIVYEISADVEPLLQGGKQAIDALDKLDVAAQQSGKGMDNLDQSTSKTGSAFTELAGYANSMDIGDMVQVPDTYDTNQQAGYIVSRNGNNFETSERINFSGSMYVQVTDSMGATTARYPASARTDTAFGFTAAIPDISLNFYDGFDVQSPSRYVIATSEELDAGQWTITAKQPDGQGGTAITLSEYSDLIYP